MKKFNILTSLALAAFFSGCSTLPPPSPPKYIVSVSGFASPDATIKKHYVIIPGNKDTTTADLEFQEYSSMLKRIVDGAGFTQVNSIDEAEVALFFSYSISDGEERTSSYTVPNFGQTGVLSSNTYGTIRSSGSGTSTFSGTTYNIPSYGITGYSHGMQSFTSFNRVIRIEAYDVKAYNESKDMKQIWKLGLSSRGSSGDLRKLVPVMLVAASPYIGKSTTSAIMIEMTDEDPRIEAIRVNLNPVTIEK
jgi:hypothetical protein